MGLFDKLFGKLKGGAQRQQQPQRPNQSPAAGGYSPSGAQRTYPASDFGCSASDYGFSPPASDLAGEIRGILRNEFSQFGVRENVAAGQIDGRQTFGAADFVLTRGDRVAAAVMLIEKNKFRTKRVWGVEMACKALRIPFITFYFHFPFSREHAIKRIAKFV